MQHAFTEKMGDLFEDFYRIKAALIAAGLHERAQQMDAVPNLGCSFEVAWGFVGRFRELIRNRAYCDALASLRTSDNDSTAATNLVHELRRYAERQFEIDRQFGFAPTGRLAALFVILNADGGKVLTHGSFRKKLAKLRVGKSAPLSLPNFTMKVKT